MIHRRTRLLKEKENFKMWIRLIWPIVYLSQGFVRAQFICMSNDVKDNIITVNCTVNKYLSNIDLKFPNNTGAAFCSVRGPVHSYTHGDCKCKLTIPGHCSITQDIGTKTTTIQISNTNLPDIFGWYTCAHGSYEKSIMVHKPDDADEIICEAKYLYYSILMMIIGLASAMWACLYCNIPHRFMRKVRNCFSSEQNQTDFKEQPQFCDICKTSFVCEICINCKEKFCDACCVHHNRSNSCHSVFHVQHIAKCQLKTNCYNCNKNLADRVCIKCYEPRCINCGTCSFPQHGEDAMRKMYEGTVDSFERNYKTVIEKMEKKYTIPVPRDRGEFPIRICGIGFLENGTLIVVDAHNRKLIVFHPNETLPVLKKTLGEEPRAMTSMTGNKIAITFPYTLEIHIYKICSNEKRNTTKVINDKTINLSEINLPRLKPFSIAFDKGVFAVEAGEGVDGRIFIIALDDDNRYTVKYRIKPNAFFTGNTIRLALDMNNGGQIFVSALGIKMVSCLKFDHGDGEEKWAISVPSPRSLIMIPEDNSPGKNLILSSRRCNAIYALSDETGDDEILGGKEQILSPRYIAYHKTGNKLCVQVAKNEKEDELVIFELKIPDQPTTTSTLLYRRKN